MFESSVNSYDSQTMFNAPYNHRTFESSVNSYDSQTVKHVYKAFFVFESSVNSYDSQTSMQLASYTGCLRVV